MKKLLVAIIGVLLLTGCTDMMNTPTKRVEEFLGKYQTMDDEVIKQLDSIIEKEGTMTDKQKKEYKDIMKKQYQNLTYKIKDETVDGDNATVEVEIEVYDYHTAINESEKYLEKNKNEFLKDVKEKIDDVKEDVEDAVDDLKGTDKNDVTNAKDKNNNNDNIDQEKYMDYKIGQLKKVKDKVKHTITFTLTKKDKKWLLDDVSEVDRLKIHGLYNY